MGNNHARLAGATQSVDEKEFLKSNIIHNNVPSSTSPVQYCHRGSRRTKRQLPQGHDMFDRIVQELRAAAQEPNQPYSYHGYMRPYDEHNFPFEEIIERRATDRIENPLYVTVYMKATIKSTHTGRTRLPVPQHIQDYLNLVGFISG